MVIYGYARCSTEADPLTKGMLMMWGVFSELERDMISSRVRSGMKNAAAKGKRIGRPPVVAGRLPEVFWRRYALYRDGKLNVSDFARAMKCSRSTIYRYLKTAERESVPAP